MRSTTFFLLAATAAAATAAPEKSHFSKRQDNSTDGDPYAAYEELDYIVSQCSPGFNITADDWSQADWSAPCNAAANITVACISGAAWSTSDDDYGEFSNATQRDCLCTSEYFSAVQGCEDCFNAHGFPSDLAADLGVPLATPSSDGTAAWSSFSSSYCAETNTPTLGFLDIVSALDTGSSIPDTAYLALSTTWSDPLSGSTAVSLYYTAPVAGSLLIDIPEATITPLSVDAALSISLATNSAGVIVPTATTQSTTATTQSTTPTATGKTTTSTGVTGVSAVTSTTANVAATPLVRQAAGVFAVAGVVAFL